MTGGGSVNQSSDSLSDDQKASLLTLVGLMIPASDRYGVPGADDPAIFDRITEAAVADKDHVTGALAVLDRMAQDSHGASFVTLDDKQRADVAAGFAAAGSQHVEAITAVTVQCYYSDERVMAALGIEERPPFPQGYDVPQGDWSLLDPVKRRPKHYREA